MKYIVTLVSFVVIVSCKAPPLVLSQGEIDTEGHKRNIGLITFMNEVVPFENYQESDFQEKVVLDGSKEMSASNRVLNKK